MYDPDGDYDRSGSTRTPDLPYEPLPLPEHVKCFCIACGAVLDNFNYQALDGYGYCTECTEERVEDCHAALAFLPDRNWSGILTESTGVLWLAPTDPRLRCASLEKLAAYLDSVAAGDGELAFRFLPTDAAITARISNANRRHW